MQNFLGTKTYKANIPKTLQTVFQIRLCVHLDGQDISYLRHGSYATNIYVDRIFSEWSRLSYMFTQYQEDKLDNQVIVCFIYLQTTLRDRAIK